MKMIARLILIIALCEVERIGGRWQKRPFGIIQSLCAKRASGQKIIDRVTINARSILVVRTSIHRRPRVGLESPHPGGVLVRGLWQRVLIVRRIHDGPNPQLFEVVEALACTRFAFGAAHGRQEHRAQDPDDGNHHQELNQCESTRGTMLSIFVQTT